MNNNNERNNPERNNSERNNDNRRRYSSNRPRHNNRGGDRRPNHNYSKSMILLKSTVIALFVVLVVLGAALFLFKKNHKLSSMIFGEKKCENVALKVNGEIDEISSGYRSVFVLVKNKDKQELIKLESGCLTEKARVVISK